jgi:hypothetical protein
MVSDHAYRTEARCVVVLFAELDPSDVQLMARRESADGVLRTTTMPTAPAAARLPRSMRGECDGHLAPRDAAVRDQALRAASETVSRRNSLATPKRVATAAYVPAALASLAPSARGSPGASRPGRSSEVEPRSRDVDLLTHPFRSIAFATSSPLPSRPRACQDVS